MNSIEDVRKRLEKEYGTVWSTEELTREFAVIGFMSPYVSVERKSDGVRGTLMFQHLPRFYFSFKED